MATQAYELRYAVRFRVVAKYVGQLCLVLAALTLAPLAVSLAFGDNSSAWRYAVVVGALLAAGGVLGRRPAPSGVQPNEGLLIVAAMFLLAPLVTSYPLMVSGMSFVDTLFEAVSAITTTGLSTRASVTDASPAFLFARAWMQWYGGLGFVVLSLALVVRPGLVTKGLAAGETRAEDDLVGGTRAHAQRVLAVYVVLTTIGIVGAWLTGIGSLDAVLYVLSSVSTGGFAPVDGSLAPLPGQAQTWIMLLCFAGAIPLTLYYRVYRQRQFVAVDLLQLLGVLGAALVSTALLVASLHLVNGLPWSQAMHHAPLLAFSAQTTTGFSALSPRHLDADSKLVLIFSMLLGGGVGSTAGGFKLLRLLIVLAVLRLIVLRACVPRHAVIEPSLAGRSLQADEIQEALLIVLLFVGVVAFSWLPFAMLGYPPIDALFEVVSAVGTVGLSVGVTHADMPLALKGVLCADMLLGRLEILAWLVVFYPGTWFGRRMEAG
jgi:trk system potassium uptake protein TrkH